MEWEREGHDPEAEPNSQPTTVLGEQDREWSDGNSRGATGSGSAPSDHWGNANWNGADTSCTSVYFGSSSSTALPQLSNEMYVLDEGTGGYRLFATINAGACAESLPYGPGALVGVNVITAAPTNWAIANTLCQDGSSWEAGICNAGPVCKMLHPGQTLKYDCSGKGTYCNGPTPTEIVI